MKDGLSLEPGENRWCYAISAVLQRLFSTNVQLSVHFAVTIAAVGGEEPHSGNFRLLFIQGSCGHSIVANINECVITTLYYFWVFSPALVIIKLAEISTFSVSSISINLHLLT